MDLDPPVQEVILFDQKRINVDAFARYKIVDPLNFFKNLRNESGADARVSDIVNAQLGQEVARDLQTEVISETREAIMDQVTADSNRIEVPRREGLNN